MNYALGYAFNLREMLMNFPVKKLKIHWTDIKKLTNKCDKIDLAARIFRESVKVIIEDIIKNNVIFLLPVGPKLADIRVKRITGDDFRIARTNGKFRDVDFLKSLFTGHQLVLNMYTHGYYRTKPIYVDKAHKDLLTKLTNEGKLYG